MKRRLLSGILICFPAVLLGILTFFAFEQGAYYTRTWQVAAVVFVSASFLLGMRIPGHEQTDEINSSAFRNRCFRCGVYAWILAVAVLFVLSFTPLCVGQDNGDGTNTHELCLVFAISSSLVYSAFSIPFMFCNSILSARVLSWMKQY